jgi:Fur family ferric uptake transcriptional regulator
MTTNMARRAHYVTRQRRAVLDALTQAPGFVSAQALHAHMHLIGETIALTTVYRTLHFFADAGHIDTTYDTTGQQLFRLGPTPGRGHYLVCRGCGHSVPIDAGTARDWAATTAADHGFTDIDPVIELVGLCPACTTATP